MNIMEKPPDIIENFYGVYLLESMNEKFLGRTYIGFTVDPNRRIKQHNTGSQAGGAKKTSNRGPWKMIMLIHGFPNNVTALRFEWAWQNPEYSKRLQHITSKKRIARKESQLQYRIRILSEMLNVGPWNRLPLTIRWLEKRENLELNKFPPMHMPTCYGSIKSKKIKNTQETADVYENSSEISSEHLICSLCNKSISHNSKLLCLNTKCDMICHIRCLADVFLEDGEYIPIRGCCPRCNRNLLWGDLIRKMKGCNDANANESPEDDIQLSCTNDDSYEEIYFDPIDISDED